MCSIPQSLPSLLGVVGAVALLPAPSAQAEGRCWEPSTGPHRKAPAGCCLHLSSPPGLRPDAPSPGGPPRFSQAKPSPGSWRGFHTQVLLGPGAPSVNRHHAGPHLPALPAQRPSERGAPGGKTPSTRVPGGHAEKPLSPVPRQPAWPLQSAVNSERPLAGTLSSAPRPLSSGSPLRQLGTLGSHQLPQRCSLRVPRARCQTLRAMTEAVAPWLLTQQLRELQALAASHSWKQDQSWAGVCSSRPWPLGGRTSGQMPPPPAPQSLPPSSR